MIPSSEAVAENIRRHCDGMAREIARRVYADSSQRMHENEVRDLVEHHARMVMLDWYLGDFIPNRADP
jgi:hypothetical protein